jgi:defect-in-organelle-trafficking protein DotA
MLKKILWFSALSLICSEALALVFSVAPTDKSLSYLGTIFGGSVGSISLGGSFNPTLSKMFQGFNFIIVSMGSIALGYLGILSTINTAREGEAMGKKLNIWVPMRSILGLLLMIPTPGSGYSIVQMTVMWIVLNGIGAANTVWNTVLNQLAAGNAAIGTVTIPLQQNGFGAVQNVATQVLYSSTCMAYVNNQITSGTGQIAQVASGTQVSVFADQPATPVNNNNTIISASTTLHVGLQGVSGYTDICGSYQISENLSASGVTQTPSISFDNATAIQRLQIKTQALSSMFSVLQDASQLLAANSSATSINQGYLNAAANSYITQMAAVLGASTSATPSSNPGGSSFLGINIPSNAPPVQTMSQLGWAHVGSFYFQIVGATGGTITDPDLIPPGNLPSATTAITGPAVGSSMPTGPSGTCTWPSWSNSLCNVLNATGQRATLYTYMIQANAYQTSDKNQPAPSLQGILDSPNNVTGNSVVDAVLNPIFNALNAPVYAFIDGLTNSNDDPLKSVANYGQAIMLACEGGIFLLIIALAMFVLAMSWESCISGFANFSSSIGGYLFFLILGLCALLWGIGATLGVYTPMVPFLVYTTSVFGWFVAVIEAVVAAPVLALGLVHPSGEELGKVGHGITILANLFLRPTLMVFGFILGANLLRAALALVNFGIEAAIHDSIRPSLFSFIPLMAMYTALILGLVSQSFSLVYKLPNQIMRWLGGGAESHEPGELTGKAKEGFETGSKTASEGMGKMIDTAQKKLADKKKKDDKLPKGNNT